MPRPWSLTAMSTVGRAWRSLDGLACTTTRVPAGL